MQHILNPRSIAIVGASSDPRSFGGFVLANLERFGYQGAIHLVSRGSAEINGRPCVATVDALPRAIDLAVLAIPEAGVLEAIEKLGQLGTRAAVLFAAGYAESGEEGLAKQAVLTQLAAQSGIRLIGPNCMGFTNFAAGVPVTFEPLAAPVARIQGAVSAQEAGAGKLIGVVAQSGFMAATLRDAFLGRGLPLGCVFSTGNEAGVRAEDVLAHYITDAAIGVVAVYAEQIRNPQNFLTLARAAQAAGKPIVMLMPGKSERARAAAQSHTGALAGDHAVAQVLLRRAGVTVVDTLDELFDATAILLCHPQPPAGGVAFMTGSGAMKNLALDGADSMGLPMPALSAGTTQALTEKLPAFAVAENPLDYTTIGVRQPGLIGEILATMLSDDGIGSLVLAIPAGPVMAQRDKAEHILPALARATKPAVLVITGDDGPMEPFFVDAIRASGVPFFRSADRALRAMRHVVARGADLADLAALAACSPAVPATQPTAVALSGPVPPSGVYAEYQGKVWLRQLGIAVPAGALATSADEAVQIAQRIAYPVVLKAQASDLPHKSDAGGVIVNLKDEAALRAGWQTMQANIAHHCPGLLLDGVLVEAMGAPGLELVIGAKRDPDWGAVLLVGLGGIWIEALKDVRLIPADLSVDAIVAELQQLKAASVLRGLRGAKPVDLAAVARVVRLLGQQMLANPSILEIDVNPLIAYPEGSAAPVVALDALVVLANPLAVSSPTHHHQETKP
jgi:acetate---CoA ligase (ADP-forming)